MYMIHEHMTTRVCVCVGIRLHVQVRIRKKSVCIYINNKDAFASMCIFIFFLVSRLFGRRPRFLRYGTSLS